VVKVNDKVRIYGSDTGVVLEAVLGYVREVGTEIASVNSLKPTLEDAFVKLTGLSPLLMAAEKGGR
jgi:ABC-2 type transport system ATP-binding protein